MSSVVFLLSSTTNVSLPPGNTAGSRSDIIEEGAYLRISIGTESDEWLLLSIVTNASSDIYVRGTDYGDVRFYNTRYVVVKCEHWFIVTVFPNDACLVHFEWISYNLTQQFDIASLYISEPLILLILITVAFDTITTFIVLRNRLEVVE